MSHGLRRGLRGVPPREMTIDCHARKAIDEGAGGKHNMTEVQTFDKLAPFVRLGQQLKHFLPDCGVLGAQAIGCLKIDEGAGIDDLEMRGVGERPLQPQAGAVIELGSDPEKTIGVVVKSNFTLFPAMQCAENHQCGHVHMKIDPKGIPATSPGSPTTA